ncbi:cell division protein FtsI (penicillin-binding protein 3) [Deinococcus metalli]|uniref:Cell division protein FtsI (Penicillin-binding protein 3) n=1 Tax=Deinococcus metalli TaxID=1141878 RepID=A0A7W8NR70_9DEIO|nr:penicillin-binding protein 2 [Deinococcus metalli]MBB5378636.1 cell division protein FtsI (penicillin-binding protein 3) [Deinococcus metalli]GHF61305.1 penicillin-binding protein 2 [Deinococcus metalli]
MRFTASPGRTLVIPPNQRWRVMRGIGLLSFSLLLVAFIALSLGPPSSAIKPAARPARGQILAADDTVLATTVNGRRRYPQGTLAGALVGFTGTDGGLSGLEASQEARLARGEDLHLTIVPAIQVSAEANLRAAVKEHDASGGAIIVLNSRTGAILAAANDALADPNHWKDTTMQTWRNRAFQDAYEPGSEMKALVVAAALDAHLTRPEAVYDTPMSRRVGRFTIHDAVPHPGQLTVQGILRYSSNVGMSLIAQALTAARLHDVLVRFGIGQPLPALGTFAAQGRLNPSPTWGEIGLATNAFGQGVTTTTVQFAAAFNTIANDGVYVPPTLILGQASAPARRLLSPATAHAMDELLHHVINDGIPHAARLRGYGLAGKTGTAQTVVNGRYSPTEYNSTFTGFFPADAPQYTISVTLFRARTRYQGSQAAAPTFRSVAAAVASNSGMAPVQPGRR